MMATAAEIANDLRARAKISEGRHLQGRMLTDDAKAMRRAADMLDGQQKVICELEQAAQDCEDRFGRYRNGDDL